jgi:hypothetical protein
MENYVGGLEKMKPLNEYPTHTQNLINRMDRFLGDTVTSRQDIVSALGFLINKYKIKGAKKP